MSNFDFQIISNINTNYVSLATQATFSVIRKGSGAGSSTGLHKEWNITKICEVNGKWESESVFQSPQNDDELKYWFMQSGTYIISCNIKGGAETLKIFAETKEKYTETKPCVFRSDCNPFVIFDYVAILYLAGKKLGNKTMQGNSEIWMENLFFALKAVLEPFRQSAFIPIFASYEFDGSTKSTPIYAYLVCKDNRWFVLDTTYGGKSCLGKFSGEKGKTGDDGILSAIDEWKNKALYPKGILSWIVQLPSGKDIRNKFLTGTTVIEKDSLTKIQAILKYTELYASLDGAQQECLRILDSIIWTTGGNIGKIEIHRSVPISHRYPTGVFKILQNQTINITCLLLGTYDSGEKWKLGSEVEHISEKAKETGRFLGVADERYAHGIIGPKGIHEKIKKETKNAKDGNCSGWEAVLEITKYISDVVKKDQFVFVDINPNNGSYPQLKQLGDPNHKISLASPKAIKASTNNSKLETTANNRSLAKGGTIYSFVGSEYRNVIPREIDFLRLTFEEMFGVYQLGEKIGQKSGYDISNKPAFIGEAIPSPKWIYIFQFVPGGDIDFQEISASVSKAKIDAGKDFVAFISESKLTAERIKHYQSNENYLISRGEVWKAADLQGKPNENTFLLNDYQEMTKILADQLKEAKEVLYEIADSKKFRLGNCSNWFRKYDPDFRVNLLTDFPELENFRVMANRIANTLGEEQERRLDALYKVKRSSQWILMAEDICSIDEDEYLEYWDSVTHDDEMEYLASIGSDPDELEDAATKKMPWIKAVNKGLKAGKFWEAARKKTISLMLKGLDENMKFNFSSRKALRAALRGTKSFDDLAKNLDGAIDKMILNVKDLGEYFPEQTRTRINLSVTHKSAAYSDATAHLTFGDPWKGPTPAPGTRIKSKWIEASAGFHSAYDALRTFETVYAHVAVGVEFVNVYLSVLHFEEKDLRGEVKPKDVLGLMYDSVSAMKECSSLFAFKMKMDPDFRANYGGKSALSVLKKYNGAMGMVAGFLSLLKGVALYNNATSLNQEREAKAEFVNGAVSIVYSWAEIAVEMGSKGIATKITSIWGVATVVAIYAFTTYIKDEYGDSLKNWPKNSKQILNDSVSWKTFDVTNFQEVKPFAEVAAEQEPLEKQIEHLIKLCHPLELSVRFERVKLFGLPVITTKFEVRVNGQPWIQPNTLIRIKNFSATDPNVELDVTKVLQIQTTAATRMGQGMLPQEIILSGNDASDGIFSFTLPGKDVRDVYEGSVEYTIQADLFGDGQFLMPPNPIPLKHEVIEDTKQATEGANYG